MHTAFCVPPPPVILLFVVAYTSHKGLKKTINHMTHLSVQLCSWWFSRFAEQSRAWRRARPQQTCSFSVYLVTRALLMLERRTTKFSTSSFGRRLYFLSHFGQRLDMRPERVTLAFDLVQKSLDCKYRSSGTNKSPSAPAKYPPAHGSSGSLAVCEKRVLFVGTLSARPEGTRSMSR